MNQKGIFLLFHNKETTMVATNRDSPSPPTPTTVHIFSEDDHPRDYVLTPGDILIITNLFNCEIKTEK